MSHSELIQLVDKTLSKLPKNGRAYDLREALKDNQWEVVKLYLIEKGLAKPWGSSTVAITAEGLRIAEEGYSKHLEQLRRAENEPRRFNRLTLWGTAASLLISALAAFYAHKDSQKSDEDKAQLSKMERTLKLQQQQLAALTAKVRFLSTSAVPSKAVAAATDTLALPQPKQHAPASTPQTSRLLSTKADTNTHGR